MAHPLDWIGSLDGQVNRLHNACSSTCGYLHRARTERAFPRVRSFTKCCARMSTRCLSRLSWRVLRKHVESVVPLDLPPRTCATMAGTSADKLDSIMDFGPIKVDAFSLLCFDLFASQSRHVNCREDARDRQQRCESTQVDSFR